MKKTRSKKYRDTVPLKDVIILWLCLPDGGDDVTGPLDDVGGDARPHHRLHRLALLAAARAHLHIHTKK